MSLATASRLLDPSSLEQYAHGVSLLPLYDALEEAALARAAREGEEDALHALVAAHLRFVVDVALTRKDCGTPLPELIRAGNRGLLAAARRFDPVCGLRFREYAVWWIRREMTSRLDPA